MPHICSPAEELQSACLTPSKHQQRSKHRSYDQGNNNFTGLASLPQVLWMCWVSWESLDPQPSWQAAAAVLSSAPATVLVCQQQQFTRQARSWPTPAGATCHALVPWTRLCARCWMTHCLMVSHTMCTTPKPALLKHSSSTCNQYCQTASSSQLHPPPVAFL
jgi:hypothetical protein